MRIPVQLVIDPEAFEVVLHEEIDHAGHGVGAVGRRSAAGEYFDVPDQRAGNLVDVGADAALNGRTGGQAAAVDQHQRTFRAQVTQVQRRGTGGAVGLAGILLGIDLRQGPHHVFHSNRTLVEQFLGVDLGYRAGADKIGPLDSRAGNDDLFDGDSGIGLLRIRRGWRTHH